MPFRYSSLLILAAVLQAQDPVFRAKTQFVQIDFAAQDREGNPVTDLRKNEVELIIDGKPQPLAVFNPRTGEPGEPVRLPRGTFTNKETSADPSQNRYTIFLLDWRNTNMVSQIWARDQLSKMLTTLPRSGKIALYVLSDSFQVVQNFISDPAVIKEKADALSGYVPYGIAGSQVDNDQLRAIDTVAAFQQIANHLRGITGQKVLIWIGLGFPDRSNAASLTDYVDHAVQIMGSSNIIVESIAANPLGGSGNVRGLGPTLTHASTLQQVADRTGGKFFVGRNDLDIGMREAFEDRTSGYDAGFYAPAELPPGWRFMELRSLRKGVTLRYREGFSVDKSAPKELQADAAMQDVLERAADATEVPITIKATRGIGNAAGILLHIHVDAGALTIAPDGTRWSATINVLTRFLSDEDEQLGEIGVDNPTVPLDLKAYEKASHDGLTFRLQVKRPAESTSLRVLVRDSESGSIGSVTIPVTDVPQQ